MLSKRNGWIVACVAIWCGAELAQADPDGSHFGWAQFGGNAQETGYFDGALTIEDGIQWSFNTMTGIKSTCLLTADGSTAIFTDTGSRVYGVVIPTSPPRLSEEMFKGIRSPTLMWEYELDNGVVGAPALGVNDSHVFVSDVTGGLYSIHAATGKLVWKRQIDNKSLGSPITPTLDGMLYIGAASGVFFAVKQETGDVMWTCTTRGGIFGAPAVDQNNTMVYFTSSDNYVYGVNLTDNQCEGLDRPQCRFQHSTGLPGCATWAQSLDSNPINKGPMVDPFSNTLYVTTSGFNTGGGTLFALPLQDGVPTATLAVANLTTRITSGPTLVTDSIVAFGAADGKLHAWDVSTTPATVAWTHTSGGEAVASKAISNGERVSYGSTSMEVYVVDAVSGDELVRVDVGGEVLASPAVTSTGWIVIGDGSGLVWCIGSTSPDLLFARLSLGAGGLFLLLLMCCCTYCICCRQRALRKPKTLLDVKEIPIHQYHVMRDSYSTGTRSVN